MKQKFIFTAILSLTILFCSAEEDPAPNDPVISGEGIVKIDISSPNYSTGLLSGDTVIFDAPKNVSSMILFVLNCDTCASTVIENGAVNMGSLSLVAGLTTGNGMGTSTVRFDQLYEIQSGVFTSTLYSAVGVDTVHTWFILGFNGSVLVAASPEWVNNITW